MPLPGDRRLCLVIMRQPPPAKKRKRPLEEVPSSLSLEVISLVRRGGRVTKKRVIEKRDFDPRASPVIFPNDEILPTPSSQARHAAPTPHSRAVPSTPVGGTSKEPLPDATSRSVSVSCFLACFVIAHSPALRPKYKTGFRIALSSSMNSFAWKPLSQTYAAPRVGRTENIVACAASLGNFCARAVYFHATRIPLSTPFRYVLRK